MLKTSKSNRVFAILLAAVAMLVGGCGSQADRPDPKVNQGSGASVASPNKPGAAAKQGDVPQVVQIPDPTSLGREAAQPVKTKNVPPVYPPAARAAKVQGTVIVEATIDRNGKVEDARVIRSIPELDRAALDAVKQWEFKPTLFNGVPISVVVMLPVVFTLD